MFWRFVIRVLWIRQIVCNVDAWIIMKEVKELSEFLHAAWIKRSCYTFVNPCFIYQPVHMYAFDFSLCIHILMLHLFERLNWAFFAMHFLFFFHKRGWDFNILYFRCIANCLMLRIIFFRSCWINVSFSGFVLMHVFH